MNTWNLRRTAGIATLALAMGTGLAACSGDEGSTAADDSTPTEETSDAAGGQAAGSGGEAASQAFGQGCSAIPDDGAGSFDGMATEPVATAASSNPLLGTLVSAVQEAELVDTLNSAEGITVFAPTDDAFAEIPEQDLNALLGNQQQLTGVLTHHVVEGQLSPEDVAGEHETLNGDMIEVTGSDESFQVGDEQAQVLCGNIPTANATVYVVDSVLMP